MQKEYKLLTEKVGIADLTPFAKIKVSGEDARKYLNYLLAGTVPKVGRTSLAHALTIGGKVYAEFTVTGLENGDFMVITGSGSELHDLRHMEEVLYLTCTGIRTGIRMKLPVLTAYFPVLAYGILGKGGLLVAPHLEDFLTGLKGSSTRAFTLRLREMENTKLPLTTLPMNWES